MVAFPRMGSVAVKIMLIQHLLTQLGDRALATRLINYTTRAASDVASITHDQRPFPSRAHEMADPRRVARPVC